MMPIPSNMQDLFTIESLNSPAGPNAIGNSLDNYLRAIQRILRTTNAKGADIAAAASIDLGAATGEFVDITGAATIVSLGTVDAGIVRTVRFTGACTLTHSANLILPDGINITTTANDLIEFRSLGSGAWIVSQSKGKAATNYPLVTVDNIPSIRTLDKNVTQICLVLGETSKADGFGAYYFYDSADTTSSDDGKAVIVANDGGRWKFIRAFENQNLCLNVGGSPNAITATIPGLKSYADGLLIMLTPAAANTGAVTININGLGAKDITSRGAQTLLANQLPALLPVQAVYDGTRFRLISSAGTEVFRNSTTTLSSVNLPHGTAPTTPNNGDVWTTTSAPFARINGTTRQLAFQNNTNASIAMTFDGGAKLTSGAGGATLNLQAGGVDLTSNCANMTDYAGTSVFTVVTDPVGFSTHTPNLRVGTDTGQKRIELRGGNGTADGGIVVFYNAAASIGGLGNGSAVLGGAYNNSLDLYANNTLRLYGQGNLGMTLDSNLVIVNKVLRLHRTDTGSEGGQIEFSRANDNTVDWALDVFGAAGGSTANMLRFFDRNGNVRFYFASGNGVPTCRAPAADGASLNLPHGTAPTTPADGDIWTEASGAYIRLNGSTRALQTANLPRLTAKFIGTVPAVNAGTGGSFSVTITGLTSSYVRIAGNPIGTEWQSRPGLIIQGIKYASADTATVYVFNCSAGNYTSFNGSNAELNLTAQA